jgi:hypothetical protein
MNLEYVQFAQINLGDVFFDSLKADYSEFVDWFSRKSNDYTYIFRNSDGGVEGFLYLKQEGEPLLDVAPPLPALNRLKIGTLKINPHGTRLGERFIKKAIDHALYMNVNEIYVTVFAHHAPLVSLLQRYGFEEKAIKTTANGTELVLVKSFMSIRPDVLTGYPFIWPNSRKFLLSLHPQWHSRLLPDSILNNENPGAVLADVSHTNSIHKIYLAGMSGVDGLARGDSLLIYRTTDHKGPAHYRSVVTSVCVVEEVRSIHSFSKVEDFLSYASSYSIFTENELRGFYGSKKFPTVIKFTYNAALPKRVTRGYMIDNLKIDSSYWGFFQLSNDQFYEILKAGDLSENIIINQA